MAAPKRCHLAISFSIKGHYALFCQANILDIQLVGGFVCVPGFGVGTFSARAFGCWSQDLTGCFVSLYSVIDVTETLKLVCICAGLSPVICQCKSSQASPYIGIIWPSPMSHLHNTLWCLSLWFTQCKFECDGLDRSVWQWYFFTWRKAFTFRYHCIRNNNCRRFVRFTTSWFTRCHRQIAQSTPSLWQEGQVGSSIKISFNDLSYTFAIHRV